MNDTSEKASLELGCRCAQDTDYGKVDVFEGTQELWSGTSLTSKAIFNRCGPLERQSMNTAIHDLSLLLRTLLIVLILIDEEMAFQAASRKFRGWWKDFYLHRRLWRTERRLTRSTRAHTASSDATNSRDVVAIETDLDHRHWRHTWRRSWGGRAEEEGEAGGWGIGFHRDGESDVERCSRTAPHPQKHWRGSISQLHRSLTAGRFAIRGWNAEERAAGRWRLLSLARVQVHRGRQRSGSTRQVGWRWRRARANERSEGKGRAPAGYMQPLMARPRPPEGVVITSEDGRGEKDKEGGVPDRKRMTKGLPAVWLWCGIQRWSHTLCVEIKFLFYKDVHLFELSFL